MSAICIVLGWWYTLVAGGYWRGFRVSGHESEGWRPQPTTNKEAESGTD